MKKLIMVLALVCAFSLISIASAQFTPSQTWGSFGDNNGQFYGMSGVATDTAGYIYVAELDNRVQKFTGNGDYVTQFNIPARNIAIDPSGNIYATVNDSIEKFDSTGTLLNTWGSTGTGNGEFNFPIGIALDSSGNIYVSDMENNRIQKLDSLGNYITSWGTLGSGNGSFKAPAGITVNGNYVYVADMGNYRIQKFDLNGNYVERLGSKGNGDTQFNSSIAVSKNDSSGNIYVADYYNGRVLEYNSNFNYSTQCTGLSYPTALVIANDKLYVLDSGNYRVIVYNNTSKVPPAITWSNPADIPYGTALSSTQLNAFATDPETGNSVPGSFVYDPVEGKVLIAGTHTLHVDFTPDDNTKYTNASKDVTINVTDGNNTPLVPIITWRNPDDIKHGTALNSTQLNAAATDPDTGNSVPGTFVYTPAAGILLGVGTHILCVDFTPADAVNYTNASKDVTISVTPAELVTDGLAVYYDGNLSGNSLVDLSGKNNTGYATSVTSGKNQSTGASYIKFNGVNGKVNIPNNAQANISSPVTVEFLGSIDTFSKYGAFASKYNALSGWYLSCSSNAPYNTARFSAVMRNGTQYGYNSNIGLVAGEVYHITATYDNSVCHIYVSNTDSADPRIWNSQIAGNTYNTTIGSGYFLTYSNSSMYSFRLYNRSLSPAEVQQNYLYDLWRHTLRQPSTITWGTPANIKYGTSLSGIQLNASASVPGSFVYTPTSGAILGAGTHTLQTTFTPYDTTNYTMASSNVPLTVNKATPLITWSNPADITYGMALSSTQLNANASVSGNYNYTPAAGTLLTEGNHTLHVDFTPNDASNYTNASKDVTINVMPGPVTDGLVVYYDGNLSGNSLVDLSKNNNNGYARSVTQGTRSTTGASYINLNGVNSKIDVSNNGQTNVSGSMSVEFIGSINTFRRYGALVSKYSNGPLGWYLSSSSVYPYNSARFSVVMENGQKGYNSNISLDAGKVYHITATYNNSSFTHIYVNGVDSTGAPAWNSPIAGNTNNITIGSGYGLNYTNGSMYTFRLYNRSLSPDEVLHNYLYDRWRYAGKVLPAIIWNNPTNISYGSALSSTQLNAVATDPATGNSVPGSFVYTPAAGTVLSAGTHTLHVDFTPVDAANYTNASKDVTINVTSGPITDGLVVYYDGNLSGNSLLDLSGNSNTGYARSVTSGTNQSTGAGYISLNGVNSRINVSNNAQTNVSGSMSVEFIGAINTFRRYGSLVSKYSSGPLGWYLSCSPIDPYNNARFSAVLESGQKAYNSNISLVAGQVYDIVATYDNNTTHIYVNGVDSADPRIWNSPTAGSNLNITIGSGYGLNYTNCSMYTFRLYNRALSQEEVLQNYDNDRWRYAPGETPAITRSNSDNITYGTAVNSTQLNAVATDPETGNGVTGNVVYTPTPDPVTNGLVVYYDGNLSGNSLIDLSGNSNTGYATSAIQGTNQSTGAGYINLNGVNSRINVSNNAQTNISSPITVEFMGSINTFSRYGSLVSKYSSGPLGWYLSCSPIDPYNSARFSTVMTTGTQKGYNSNISLVAGQVYDIVATYDNNTTHIYVNGVDSADPRIWNSPTAGSNLNITIGSGYGLNYTNCSMYTFRLYNRALSQEEVLQNYNNDSWRYAPRETPTITWNNPANLTYGILLSSTQLNAVATDPKTGNSVPGNFVYTPAAGTLLDVGTHTLHVDFTPADTANYTNASKDVTINISETSKITPTITWSNPANITYGTALNSTQLNANASVTGSFVYTPASGTILGAGTHTLQTTFTPTDITNYTIASSSVSLTVNKATPLITWSNPANITYGTALSSTQLNANASVPGNYNYTPASGTLLGVGIHTLHVDFTPTDTANYTNASKDATINVTGTQVTPTITWNNPANITYGTALNSTQLNANASVPGNYNYTPASGTLLGVGTHTLHVDFTPADAVKYTNASKDVTINVEKKNELQLWTFDSSKVNAVPDSVYTVSKDIPYTSNISLTYNSTLKSIDSKCWRNDNGETYFTGAYPTVNENLTFTMGVDSNSPWSFGYMHTSVADVGIRHASDGSYWIYSYWTADNGTQLNSNFQIPAASVVNNRVTLSIHSYDSNRTNVVRSGPTLKVTTPYTTETTRKLPYTNVIQPLIYLDCYASGTGSWVNVHLYNITQSIPRDIITPYARNDIMGFGFDYPNVPNNKNGTDFLISRGQSASVYLSDTNMANSTDTAYDKSLFANGFEEGIHFYPGLTSESLEQAKQTIDSHMTAAEATFGSLPTSWACHQNEDTITHAIYAYNKYGALYRNGPMGMSFISNVDTLSNATWAWWSVSSARGAVSPCFTHRTDEYPAIPYSIDPDLFENFVTNLNSKGINLVNFSNWYYSSMAQIATTNILQYDADHIEFQLNTSGGYPVNMNMQTAISPSYLYCNGVSIPFNQTSDGIQFMSVGNGTYTLTKSVLVPSADFTSNKTEGTVPLSVKFTDTSTNNPTSWEWNFRDGNTSTERNPEHTFSNEGIYNVTLVATGTYNNSTPVATNASNSSGLSPTDIKSKNITVKGLPAPPVANFTANKTEGNAPLTVKFTDTSTNSPIRWEWSFGDGATSTDANPIHVYATARTYVVNLTVSNEGGTDTKSKTINVTGPVMGSPKASFTAVPQMGSVPLTVKFTDKSVNATSITWDFGDKSGISTELNPSHIYTTTGFYTVKLTATNGNKSSAASKIIIAGR